jgi:hypothetical protein
MVGSEVCLYWLPLGAGGRSVRWNGRVFERLVALREHRPPCDLYHAALTLTLAERRYVVEMAPEWSGDGDRGVVRSGPVGMARLGRSRWFRYEVRLWRDGTIPDLDEAVGGPMHLATDPDRLRRLFEAAPHVPAATWGRDELGLGEMWNSNSVVSWLLAVSGHHVDTLAPPTGGRAPGWDAGLALARRTGAGSCA